MMTQEQRDAARDADDLEPVTSQEEIEASVPEDVRALRPASAPRPAARTVGRKLDVLLWAIEQQERRRRPIGAA